MLTWSQLETFCNDGQLVRWKAGERSLSVGGRGLYMLTDVHSRFTERPWPDASDEDPRRTRERRGAMRNVLERYVKGQAIRLNYDLKELGTLNRDQGMRGYWEFRSQGPMTETRLFGFVPLPGAFVATDFQSRAEFESAADWAAQRAACGQRWDSLTSGAPFMNTPWPVDGRSALAAYLDRADD